MRGSRTPLVAAGALASAGLLVVLATSATGFGLSQSGSTSGSSSTASTTSTSQGDASGDAAVAALLALAAGGKTVAGPGTFLGAVNDSSRIYQVLSGPSANTCLTLLNLSGGEIGLRANGATSLDVGAGETRSACFGGLVQVDLICRRGTRCEGVWRVDRP